MENCIIGLPVYNASQYISHTIKNIELLEKCFKNTKIIFVYDKSKDNTLNLLKNYVKDKQNVTIYINEVERISNRTINIARARNKILEFIYSSNNNKDYKYFIMLDCNYNNYKTIDVEILKKYLLREDWDCLTFNQDYYYDIWALSITPYYLSCWAWSCGHKVKDIMQKYITYVLSQCKEDDLVPCLSAFNGIGIYRKDKFINCYYEGNYHIKYLQYLKCNLNNNINILKNISKNVIKNYYVGSKGIHTNQDCEHRNFHLMAIIKNNARIRISPLYLLK